MEIILPRNKKQVIFYDDIKELPVARMSEFQVQLLQDAGMGSSIMDIDNRLAKHDTFVAAGRLEDAQAERINLSFGLHFLFERIDTKTLSLSYLVKSINGVEKTVETEKQALEVAKELESGGITYKEVIELIETLKKKSIAK
jgi:hypothetical protein